MIDPDLSRATSTASLCGTTSNSLPVLPTDGWEDIKQASNLGLRFNNAQIITYFVTRTADDGLPVGDFKSINDSALNLYVCGHVQEIQVCHDANSNLCIRAKCLPEMRKDRMYLIEVTLDDSSHHILSARCGCAAGRGPKASCKHIAALCYALEEFSKVSTLPELITCTDKLQSWNQPRPRKLKAVPVDSLRQRQQELKPPKKQSLTTRVASEFDPRPKSMRVDDPKACEELRCRLLALNKPCAFLHILVPDTDKVFHDHNYAQRPCDTTPQTEYVPIITPSSIVDTKRILTLEEIDQAKHRFLVSAARRQQVEEHTRDQSLVREWHDIRAMRITSSICGRILVQKRKTVALLMYSLYPKPLLEPLPPPIAWGRKHEATACTSYKKLMLSRGHNGLCTYPCGFIIHPSKGWLGASPDAKVVDSSFALPNGIAEFKCPFAKRDKSPQECCEDPSFYCSWENGHLHLKQDHPYYHQVQLQLYVACEYRWCDFCVYTPKGTAVQRIFPDKLWQSKCIPELDNYYFNHMLPEILDPKLKPSYIL